MFKLMWIIPFCVTLVRFGRTSSFLFQAGACLGRAIGEFMLKLGLNVHPGVYVIKGQQHAACGAVPVR